MGFFKKRPWVKITKQKIAKFFSRIFGDGKRTGTVSKASKLQQENRERERGETGCHQEFIQASWVNRPRRLQASKQLDISTVVVLVYVIYFFSFLEK